MRLDAFGWVLMGLAAVFGRVWLNLAGFGWVWMRLDAFEWVWLLNLGGFG